MSYYYIGLGSNMGDRAALLRKAVLLLTAPEDIYLEKLSSLYETPPWGKIDQPLFLNAVAAVRTGRQPEDLLHFCQSVEHRLGRVRHEKWGARTIDIDLLYSAGQERHTPELCLPHPYLTQRAFVLVPLQEIAPDLCIDGRPVASYVSIAEEAEAIHCIGTLDMEV